VISIGELEQISGIRLFPQMRVSSKQTAMDLPDPETKNSKPHNPFTDKDIIRLLEKLFKGSW
jgi:hypothetical protein